MPASEVCLRFLQARIRFEDAYVLVKNQGRAIAGMFSYEPPDGEKDGATWIALMSVLDPDHAASVVTAHGGSIEIEAATVAGGGFTIVQPNEELFEGNVAVFVDPNGGVDGIVRYEYDEDPAP